MLEGVLASTALPPWIRPLRVDGRSFIDGGLVSNLPIEAALQQGAAEIVAVIFAVENASAGIDCLSVVTCSAPAKSGEECTSAGPLQVDLACAKRLFDEGAVFIDARNKAEFVQAAFQGRWKMSFIYLPSQHLL